MAVREFTDERGVTWQVWDVVPGRVNSGTLSEDYLARLRHGWLAFEASSGERRRLPAPYPAEWHQLPLRDLRALAERAPVVSKRVTQTQQPETTSGEYRKLAADADEEALREALREGQRTFDSPGGKTWRVRLHERVGADGDPETVLRFTCGDVVLDLRPWPTNWSDFPATQLATLVLDAEPPLAPTTGRRPRRRREDRAP